MRPEKTPSEYHLIIELPNALNAILGEIIASVSNQLHLSGHKNYVRSMPETILAGLPSPRPDEAMMSIETVPSL